MVTETLLHMVDREKESLKHMKKNYREAKKEADTTNGVYK